MTSSDTPSSQTPSVSIASPPQSKEPPTSSSNKATLDASRNDDSNPQQGTGLVAAGTPTTQQSHVTVASPPPRYHHGMQRPSLKIPPTAKDDRKLFVGGLPADVTNEEFSAFFAQFGKVIDCIVMFDYATGRSRGFGFVTYEDPNVSRHLLSLGHEHNTGSDNPHLTGRIQMRDKLVEIKAAEPKEGRGGGRAHHQHQQQPRRKGGASHEVASATVVPEAYPVAAEDPNNMYAAAPYGHFYPAMPTPYGYPVPAYGAASPAYAPTPAPYPAAGFVPGYMAPVFYPSDVAAAPPAPVMPDPGFAGYAFIPFVPPSPPEQK